MTSIGKLIAGQPSGASWLYRYNDTDDLLSLARFLHLSLSPDATSLTNPAGDQPYIFPEPREGTFQRPSITIHLVTTQPGVGPLSPTGPTYIADHAFVLTAFGTDRAQTMRIAQDMRRCFEEGGFDSIPYSVPLFMNGDGVQLARRMRVLRASLSMGFEQTDDEAKWSRPLEVRLQSPRLRMERPVPIIERVVTTLIA